MPITPCYTNYYVYLVSRIGVIVVQFNNRLRALRQDKDLTQDTLAKNLNINRKTLSNYETGSRTPDIYLIIKMAEYFDVSVDYMLGRIDFPTQYTKK